MNTPEAHARQMVGHVLDTMRDLEKLYGVEHAGSVGFYFLQLYVAAAVTNVLLDYPKGLSEEDKVKYVFDKFKQLKSSVQDAVAAGTGAAMTYFAKKPVEYYCQITVVPDPVNKLPS